MREVGASSAMTLGYALRPSTATASGRASGSASSAISCFSARSLSAAPPRPSSACAQDQPGIDNSMLIVRLGSGG